MSTSESSDTAKLIAEAEALGWTPQSARQSDHGPFTGDFAPDGSVVCTKCGHEPCRCGVPSMYAAGMEKRQACIRALLAALKAQEVDALSEQQEDTTDE